MPLDKRKLIKAMNILFRKNQNNFEYQDINNKLSLLNVTIKGKEIVNEKAREIKLQRDNI